MEARARGLELAIAKLEGLCHRATEDTRGSHLSEWIQDKIEDILPRVGGQQCNVRERVLQTFIRIRADEKTMLEGALASLTVIGEEVRRMTEGGSARVDQEGDCLMQEIEAACSRVVIECSLDAALDEAPTSSLPVSSATAFGFGPDAFSPNPFKVVVVLEEMLTRIEGLSGLELEDAIEKLKSFDMDEGHDASDNDSRRKRFAIRAKQSACASGWPSSEGLEEELEELRQLPAKMGDVWKTAVDDLANALRESDAHLSEDPALRARRHLTASGVLTEPLHPIEDPRLDASIPLTLRGAGSPRAIFDSERRLRCGRHAHMAWFVGALNVSALRENESLDNPLSADSVGCCAGEARVLQALCERKLMDLLASHRGSVEEMQDSKIAALQQFIRDCIAEDLRRSEILPSSVRKTLLRAASESEVYEVAAPPELHEWEREATSTSVFNTAESPDRRSSIWALASALYGSDDDDDDDERLVGEFATALRWWVRAISKQLEFSLVLAAARLETGGSEKNGDWPGRVIRRGVDEAVLRYMEIATLRGPVMKGIAEANRERLVEAAVVECQYSLESIYTQDAEYLDIEEIQRLQGEDAGLVQGWRGAPPHEAHTKDQSFLRLGPFVPADVVQQVLDGTRTSVDFAISRILGDVDEVPCDLRDDPFDVEFRMKLRRNDTVMSAATVGPASPCRALDFSDDPPGPVVDDDAPLPTWHSSYGDLRSRLDYTRRLHGGMRDEQISDLCSALGIPNHHRCMATRTRYRFGSAREKEDTGELPEQLTPLPSILVLGPKGTGKSSVMRQLLSGVLLRSRVHRSAEAAFNGARPVGRVFGHGEGVIEEETTQETFRGEPSALRLSNHSSFVPSASPRAIPKCSGCTGDNIILYVDCGLCSSVGNVMTSLLTTLDRILADPDIQVKSTSPSPAQKKRQEVSRVIQLSLVNRNHPKSADANSPPTRRRSVRAGTPGSGTPARKTRGRAASASVCTPGGTGPETETPVRRSARKAARNDRMWLADRDRFTLSDDASQDHNPVESISSRLPGRLEPVAEDISDYGDEDDTEMTAASSVTSSVTTSAKLPPEDMQAIARRFLQSVVDGPGGAAELTVPKALPSSVTQQIDRYSKNCVRRVDGSGFAKKLTDLLRRYDALQKTLVLVVDRAERLLPDAAYALQPATEAARLIEFLLNMSDELCLPTACSVLVSSTPILRDSGGVVRFPPYTNAEAVALLSAYCHARAPIRDIPGAVTAFSEMYVKLFYDALTVVDMGILLENALEIYVVEYLNIVNETWGRATLENCEAEDEDDSFGSAVYDEVSSEME
ncbi:hypothetical protein FOZ60_013101 [Perkinsus olseni]|uniref:Uncharacterized protein n=1 Tax=Perkinsus olseni TaxID=32597 RepID=A0A7J6N9Y5_PEROL|nr:hypothetical protein FOZ60_013101 [Perkinsus olseni]